jgi:hypothetical protein
MLPVFENLSEDESILVNHYWLYVINIRDRRIEVLDSIRTLLDSKFKESVNKITVAVKALWEENYASSIVKFEKFEDVFDIKPPKQLTKLVPQIFLFLVLSFVYVGCTCTTKLHTELYKCAY